MSLIRPLRVENAALLPLHKDMAGAALAFWTRVFELLCQRHSTRNSTDPTQCGLQLTDAVSKPWNVLDAIARATD
jgi:hypothetical protein